MLDFPLQLLIGIVAALVFWRRGDPSWVAVIKGGLVSLIATFILGIIFWITSWRPSASVRGAIPEGEPVGRQWQGDAHGRAETT